MNNRIKVLISTERDAQNLMEWLCARLVRLVREQDRLGTLQCNWAITCIGDALYDGREFPLQVEMAQNSAYHVDCVWASAYKKMA